MGDSDNPVLRLVQSLAPAVSYKESNVETNRKVWNNYAKDWKPDQDWVVKMASNLGEEWATQGLEHVGDEWSDRASLAQVLDEVAPHCSLLHCFDISSEMLKRAQAAVSHAAPDARCEYHPQEGNELPPGLASSLDFAYAFDCLPHCDAHTIYAYLREFARCLKPGGIALVHTSNFCAPGGFARFARQREASVQGFCWVSPEMVRAMVRGAGLELERESAPSGSNVYYDRDYLCLVRRPVG